MSDGMVESIRRDTAITLMKVTIQKTEDSEVRQGVQHANNKPKTVVNSAVKIGRNDPCPCGSGKKYKNCCGRNNQQ